MHALRETMHSLRSSPVFAFFALITLAYAGLIGLMVGLMALRLDFLLPMPFARMTHFTEPHHRVHDLTFGFLFAPAVVGILAQLRRPAKNIACMLMALIPWGALLLAAVLSDAFVAVVVSNPSRFAAVLTVFTAILHPTGHDFFRSLSLGRVNWKLLALVVIAAVPLLVFASTNIGLQAAVTDDHAAAGHYGFMAAFSFTVIALGVLTSLRPDGWRLTAWVAGLLSALLGLTSLIYPDATSSLGRFWALASMAWGVMFVAAAELTQGERPTRLDSRDVPSRSARD